MSFNELYPSQFKFVMIIFIVYEREKSNIWNRHYQRTTTLIEILCHGLNVNMVMALFLSDENMNKCNFRKGCLQLKKEFTSFYYMYFTLQLVLK